MNIINQNLFKRVYQKITGSYYNVSYSQTGEDLIIDFLRQAKKLREFTYLDIGANHPVKINNTFKFYEMGYSGVCVEPDPFLFTALKKKRRKDVCINVGVAPTCSPGADFYVMEPPVLNTFSKQEAEELEKNKNAKLKNVIQVPLKTVEEIIIEFFSGTAPTFINLDVEGLDEEILKTFPFERFRPTIFCIETVHYTNDASSKKRVEIFELMRKNQYEVFADTYINTIFINSKLK